MPISVNVGGTWQSATPFVNVGGTWQQVQYGYANVNGVWEQFFQFASAPTISVQPSNQSITAGSTATFSVTGTGNPLPAYQWYKNGAAISGAINSTYTTPAEPTSDNGATFYVVLTNSAGSITSSTATLTVSHISPVNRTYTTPGSYTDVVPSGAAQVVIEAGGAGGGGESGAGSTGSPIHNAGGGGGGYSRITIALTPSNWGQSFAVVVGSGGNGGASGVTGGTTPGGASSVVGLGASIHGNGGGGANITGGAGGTASGGSPNTSGAAGQNENLSGTGGNGVTGILISSGPGGGSPGLSTSSGGAGGNGACACEYT